MSDEIKIIGGLALVVIIFAIVFKRFSKIGAGENPDKGFKKFLHVGALIWKGVIFILALPYNFVYHIAKYFLSKSEKLKSKMVMVKFLSIFIAVIVSIPIYLGIWAYVPTLY